MLLDASTYAGIYPTIDDIKYRDPVIDLFHWTCPSEDNLTFKGCAQGLFKFFTSHLLSPPHHFELKTGGVFEIILLFV